MLKPLSRITLAASMIAWVASGCAPGPTGSAGDDGQRAFDADAVILVKGIT